MESIGWFSGIMLAFCGLPQAYHSIKYGNSDGVSWGFLSMWGLGEIFGLIYVVSLSSAPLTFNYFLNIIFISIIARYKIWRKS
jgi:uncharacterized protein with PQ loop repeat